MAQNYILHKASYKDNALMHKNNLTVPIIETKRQKISNSDLYLFHSTWMKASMRLHMELTRC